jgi:hypothetical protein
MVIPQIQKSLLGNTIQGHRALLIDNDGLLKPSPSLKNPQIFGGFFWVLIDSRWKIITQSSDCMEIALYGIGKGMTVCKDPEKTRKTGSCDCLRLLLCHDSCGCYLFRQFGRSVLPANRCDLQKCKVGFADQAYTFLVNV